MGAAAPPIQAVRQHKTPRSVLAVSMRMAASTSTWLSADVDTTWPRLCAAWDPASAPAELPVPALTPYFAAVTASRITSIPPYVLKLRTQFAQANSDHPPNGCEKFAEPFPETSRVPQDRWMELDSTMPHMALPFTGRA